jgi:hypothetical protein
MGCGASKQSGDKVSSGGGAKEVMLRADGSVRTLDAEAQRMQELKAQESAARLAAMMKELGLGMESYKLVDDKGLVAALQRQWYGATIEISEEQFTPYLQATLAVAAADGLAGDEARWLKARTLLLGLTPAQSAELLQFDCRAASIEPCLDKIKAVRPTGSQVANGVQRLLLYDGLTMASQDGFSLDERVRASRAAEILALDELTEVEPLKELVAAEEMLQKRKATFFSDEEAAEATAAAALDRRSAMQVLTYGAVLPLTTEMEQR